MRLFHEITGKGTYATQANAVKRIEAISEKFAIDFRYIIAVSEEGRFFPVVILRQSEQYLAGALPHNGICVTF